jgi:hypothetical protein
MKGVMTRLRVNPPKPAYAATQKAEPSTDAAAKTTQSQTFGQAFAAARKAAGGAGGKFTYGGKEYQTNIKGERYSKAPKTVSSSSTKTPEMSKSVTPGSTSIAAQPAPPASATKDMSSAAEKVGISQTPTGVKTEFGAGKSLASLPTKSTAAPSAPKTVQNPDQERTKVTPSLPSMATSAGGASNDAQSGYDKMKAMPTSTPPGVSGSVTTKDSSLAPKKQSSMVAESFVSVGVNKYRIV